MDYEKKYKEALDKASVWHQQCIEGDNTSRAERLENIFPELKDSEDERIRKELIGMVKEDWPGREDVIAWLEKQVEQKPAWSEEDESYLNTTIAYLKDAKEFKKTAENCINWLKSLKDQYQVGKRYKHTRFHEDWKH